MTPNHKLTHALKGRAVIDFENQGGTLILRFKDGTTMRLKGTPAGSGVVPQGGKVVQAFEHGRGLEIRFEDGQSAVVWLEEAPGSVSVCDAAGQMLYLG